MIDRDKISRDIELLKNKHGSFRAVAKISKINKASLENYFDKTTEPREKNIIKLAAAAHRDPAYYYTHSTGQGEMETTSNLHSDITIRMLLDRIVSLETQFKEFQDKKNQHQDSLLSAVEKLETAMKSIDAIVSKKKFPPKKHSSIGRI